MNIIKDLRQRHLEAWEDAYFRLSDGKKGMNSDNGAVVRAAVEAGWLDGDPGDVGEMKPAGVIALAKKINNAYTEATTLDPNL